MFNGAYAKAIDIWEQIQWKTFSKFRSHMCILFVKFSWFAWEKKEVIISIQQKASAQQTNKQTNE